MKWTRLNLCFLFCFVCLFFKSDLSSSAPQSLDELFVSGKITINRSIVVSEKDFPDEVYFQNPRGLVAHSDGRIYVIDSTAHDIKMISPEGKLIKLIGQEGQGPGDFYSPNLIEISRDRLIVWESMNRRFSILDMDGKFIKSKKIDEDWGRPIKLRALPDGRLVLMTEALVENNDNSPQLYRLILLSSDLDFVKTLYSKKLRRRTFITEPMRLYVPQPYSPNIHWDVTSEGFIVLGCSDLYEFQVFDPDRGPLFAFSHDYSPVKINDLDKTDHFSIFTITVFRGNKKETKQGAPDYIKDNTHFPKYKPAFKEIFADDEGHIWVRPFHKDRELENHLFDIFDRKGQFLKRVQVFGDTKLPSFWTSKMENRMYWEIEKVDEEYFRIVRIKIGE